MKFLLDVNALVALKHARSIHHGAISSWVSKKDRKTLATCALTELGFIRVSMQAYGVTMAAALTDLAELKSKFPLFIERAPAPDMPAWADTAAKTTDAYLVQLAAAHGMTLATFDRGITGAYLIK